MFSSLLVFSVALLFILFSAKDWKRYAEKTDFLVNMSHVSFHDWRFDFTEANFGILAADTAYLNKVTDSLLKKVGIVITGKSWPITFSTTEAVWPPKGNSLLHFRMNPEKMTIADFLSNYEMAPQLFKPVVISFVPPIERFIEFLDSLRHHDPSITSFVERTGQLDIYAGNLTCVFDLSITLLKDGARKMYSSGELAVTNGNSDDYPSYGKWLEKQIKTDTSFANLPPEVDSMLEVIKYDDASISKMTFGDAATYMRNETEKRQKKVEFLGMEIDFDFIAAVIPVIFLGFFVVLFVMLGDLTASLPPPGQPLANEEYWFLLKRDWIGTVSSLLAVLFPLAVFGFAIANFWGNQSRLFKAATALAFALSTLLAVLSFIRLHHIRPRFSALASE